MARRRGYQPPISERKPEPPAHQDASQPAATMVHPNAWGDAAARVEDADTGGRL